MNQSDNPLMNLLVTLNAAYLPKLNVMLTSLLQANQHAFFRVYLLYRAPVDTACAPDDSAFDPTREILWERGELRPIAVAPDCFANAPTTARYPTEIYYRIFAARFLPPEVTRVLYLDPDLIVNGDLRELYDLPMNDWLFAAASHVGGVLHRVNEYRIDLDESAPYINSGVMLMNLEKLRAVQDEGAVYNYIDAHRKALILPDQDIISGLYGPQILALDPYRYNMTERLYAQRLLRDGDISVDWVRKHSAIIHYCGRNKPWKPNYLGALDIFWHEAENALHR